MSRTESQSKLNQISPKTAAVFIWEWIELHFLWCSAPVGLGRSGSGATEIRVTPRAVSSWLCEGFLSSSLLVLFSALMPVSCYRWIPSSWGTCALPRNTTRRGRGPSLGKRQRRRLNRWGPLSDRCTDVLQEDFIPNTIKPCFENILSVSLSLSSWNLLKLKIKMFVMFLFYLSIYTFFFDQFILTTTSIKVKC